MDNLPEEILAEKENIENTLKNLTETIERKNKTIIELAAIGTFLHNFYSGIENILKQLLKKHGIRIPASQNWHKELLNKSLETRLIPKELSDELFEYLSFRHFFIHSYGFKLEEKYLKGLAEKAPNVWKKFIRDIKG